MNPKMKKILMSLLLLLVILLFFGVLLYDYIPVSQTMPSVMAYEAPEEVKEQLKEIATEDTSDIILTYEISDSDLGVYEDTKSYDKGKANPFSTYMSGGSVTTNNANSSTTTQEGGQPANGQNSNATPSTNQNQPSSTAQNTNTFYEDTTTK